MAMNTTQLFAAHYIKIQTGFCNIIFFTNRKDNLGQKVAYQLRTFHFVKTEIFCSALTLTVHIYALMWPE